MKTLKLFAAPALMLAGTALALAATTPAMAQQVPAPVMEAGHTLLSVTAQGSTTRTPDMAGFSAGVTTQGTTASEALAHQEFSLVYKSFEPLGPACLP